MSLANVTGVFPGATVSGGDLTIPSGSIVSYVPVSTSNPSGAELVYGLLETMAQAVAGANYTNVDVATTSTLTTGGTILRKIYTYTVNLDFDNTLLDQLDVKPEA